MLWSAAQHSHYRLEEGEDHNQTTQHWMCSLETNSINTGNHDDVNISLTVETRNYRECLKYVKTNKKFKWYFDFIEMLFLIITITIKKSYLIISSSRLAVLLICVV